MVAAVSRSGPPEPLKARTGHVDNTWVGGTPEDLARPRPPTGPAEGDGSEPTASAEAVAAERGRALAALLALAEDLADERSVDDIAVHVAGAAVAATGARRAVVLVWDDGDGLLVRRGVADAEPDAVTDAGPAARAAVGPTSAPLPPSTVAGMVRRGTPVPLRAGAGGILGAVGWAAGIDSGTIVPLVAGGELLGALVVDDGAGPPARLTGVAALAATGLGNAGLLQHIRHLAEHDPLTGLPTLRLAERLAATGLADARRRGAPGVVLFVDLDHFRGVNERLGHSCGDRLLVQAAGRLRAAVRGADVVGRVGGDEFVVVLSQVGHLAGAQAVAERIVRSLAEPFSVDGVTVSIGATVGVALSSPDDVALGGPLARADAAMDRAKRAGPARIGIDRGGVVDPLGDIDRGPAAEAG